MFSSSTFPLPKFQFICIDVANGYSENFSNFVSNVRKKYPKKTIIAGNVVTADMTQELVLSGADIVKVGIGPGSVCTTRIQTGVGYPQLSCILECADAAHGLGGLVMSDGGCVCPGDFAKAFGAGADFVMIGGEFAGHFENPGEVIEENGEHYKFFYGMSSSYAMKNNYASNNNTNYRSSEGREIKVKYKGMLDNTVKNYLGGLRSTCAYTNSLSIEQLSSNCKFILVNNQYNSNLVNGK